MFIKRGGNKINIIIFKIREDGTIRRNISVYKLQY